MLQLLSLYERWAPVPACTAVCPQLPCWRTCATNPAQGWLCPPSTAMFTVHLPSFSWGHHQAKAERITSCSCPTLQQVRSPSYLQECLSCGHLWAQNATLLLPQANTRLLLLWAAPTLCPQGTLCCCLILFCKRASANFHSVRTSKFYVCNSWLLKRK